MKLRDRENRKMLTGFRDMADFVTGNRDPIPPLVGPRIDNLAISKPRNFLEITQVTFTSLYKMLGS